MIKIGEQEASMLVSRINEKRDTFLDSPSFLAFVDSIEKELFELTEDELEWIHMSLKSFGEEQMPAFDGDVVRARRVFLQTIRKIKRQIKRIRNPQQSA